VFLVLAVYSVTSELLVCNTSPDAASAPAAAAVHDSTITSAALSAMVPPGRPDPGPLRRHSQVAVVIDDDLVTSDAASFTYVDDPVISDVIGRASIFRCVLCL